MCDKKHTSIAFQRYTIAYLWSHNKTQTVMPHVGVDGKHHNALKAQPKSTKQPIAIMCQCNNDPQKHWTPVEKFGDILKKSSKLNRQLQ